VFVNASLSDAFPLPVVEGMAAGLPVIASAVGGIPEAVQDGETGFLIRPDDVDGLAAAMRRLLAGNELRERMGSLGRKRALGMFAWEVIARRTEDLYAREFAPVVGHVRRVAVQ
jgi:glycosyltransferase involved in cell wall biosynthesis